MTAAAPEMSPARALTNFLFKTIIAPYYAVHVGIPLASQDVPVVIGDEITIDSETLWLSMMSRPGFVG
jgi:hypothetical protein